MSRPITLFSGVLLVAVLALAGCAAPTTAPTAWQSTVETVADQASTGDYASALATLDALDADVVARRDSGELSAAEADAILGRIATVRADLSVLVPTPTPTSEPVTTTEPEPAPTTPDDSTDEGDDESVDPGDDAPNGPDDKGPGGSGKDKGGQGPSDDKGPGKKHN
ncbi:MAG: hypothetical protein K0S37_1568 [Microbacterium sp.]|nr:hypothetical protein [Microbacterium sp.]